MAGRTFSVGAKLPRIADALELNREGVIASTLEVLIDMGFERARYYEAAYDFAAKKDVVVLTAQVPKSDSEDLVGELFDYATSTLKTSDSDPMPAVGEPSEESADDPPWVGKLDLRDKVWVEIPVLAGNRRLGVLAGDWTGKAADLTDVDREALRMVGTQLGSHLGLKPITMLRVFRDRDEDLAEMSVEQIVIDSARRLAKMLDVAATAVFAFSWPHQTLTKIDESVAGRFKSRHARLDELEEQYAVGEYLTGSAWEDDEVRHVVSFDSLDREGKDLVAPDSRRWHAELLGEVRSVMYTIVGGLDKRYLIRFINRANRPELPFLAELSLLDAMVPDLRSEVDGVVATRRSQSLEDMAQLTAQVTDPKELVLRVTEALTAEAVDHFAVVCHQEEAAQFGFSAFRGGDLSGEPLSREAEWQEDPLYATAVRSQGHSVRRLADHKGELASRFRGAGFRSVLTLPLSAGQTRGAFFIPMKDAGGGTKSGQLPNGCGFGTVSLLHAYSRLIANSVETSHSRAKADGARRALGSLGHELRTPLAAMQSELEMSMNTAKRTLRAVDIEPRERARLLGDIAKREEQMNERSMEVDHALRLSPIVARESENKLQVHFERARIVRVVERAVEETEEILRKQPDNAGRRYTFEIADSCTTLGSAVCDRIYLRHVIRNLLQNAVNYSLPRQRRREGQRPEPMSIDIFGEAQTASVAVKVRNWGFGIPEEKRDVIFEPWVRGEVSDSKKAIRGMGLGLFLVRRIVSAHGGRIILYSNPTLKDPARRARNEGFETTFEVRIPNDLEEGTFVHKWVDNRPQPLEAVGGDRR